MAKKEYAYAKSANGMLVRVPVDKFHKWKKAQEEIASGKRKADPEMVKKLREIMEGD